MAPLTSSWNSVRGSWLRQAASQCQGSPDNPAGSTQLKQDCTLDHPTAANDERRLYNTLQNNLTAAPWQRKVGLSTMKPIRPDGTHYFTIQGKLHLVGELNNYGLNFS